MKKIILIFLILTSGCTKIDIPKPPPQVSKIFNISESTITDGQSIYFDLPTSGIYTLTLIDKNTNQVISRERFNGQMGENVKKIYTKSISVKSLYLVLEDLTKKEIGKTTIIIN